MKQKLFSLVTACIVLSTGLFAKTTNNFNTLPGIPRHELKAYLESHCWAFPGFEVNRNNWNPGIEGDGAMVSIYPSKNMGIFTPVLDVTGKVTISFTYKFNNAIQAGARNWLKIYLTDASNTIVAIIDSLDFKKVSTSTFYNYTKAFTPANAGLYKVYIRYDGVGGNTSIAIDELDISATLHYAGGCNTPPVTVNDKFAGLSNRHAEGQVTLNDKDADNESFSAYLITNSPDGTVVLNTDGNFTFTPSPAFSGKSTSFAYKICDKGSLCSGNATVTINFPANNRVPVSLVDFKGLYLNNGDVELSWVTNVEPVTNRFEVERSFDGNKWKKVGSLDAQKISPAKTGYEFVDAMGRSKVEKKDIYYRLKQYNQDGAVAMSRILVVRVYNTRALKMLSVTPNPSINDIAVTTQLNENSFVAMKILNAAGNIVMKKSVKADAGNKSYMIEGSSNLKPGEYSLEVTVNSKERMIVQLIKE